jgi:hypothetical protein
MTQDNIDTSAEQVENLILPLIHEVHTDPNAAPAQLPANMQKPVKKSPAQWAYERIILYIQNFEKQLDNEHEVGMGFVGGDAGIMRIEGLGYFDPDIITYYGSTPDGAKTQLVQHVSQLNVMLRAAPKHTDQAEPNRIGFRLAEALGDDQTSST